MVRFLDVKKTKENKESHRPIPFRHSRIKMKFLKYLVGPKNFRQAPLVGIALILLGMQAVAGTTYIVAGALVDPLSEKLIRNPVVRIDGSRVVSVISNGTVPESAMRIDLGDATLVPGLADEARRMTSRSTPCPNRNRRLDILDSGKSSSNGELLKNRLECFRG